MLCLNYDGMYGINNINRVMQSYNQKIEHNFGVDVFKVGDPIVFNDCPRFSGFIYNNTKGKIIDIKDGEDQIAFFIEVDRGAINIECAPYDVELFEVANEEKIGVGFVVYGFEDKADDEDEYGNIIPFNLAYALSIHKAQGLEYNSVKVIITQNVEDKITKNIFYTAITRAKKRLKIYWSPESQDKVFDGFDEKGSNRDIGIIKRKMENPGIDDLI